MAVIGKKAAAKTPTDDLGMALMDQVPANRAVGMRDFISKRPTPGGWERRVVDAFRLEQNRDARGLMGCSMGFYPSPIMVNILIDQFQEGLLTDTLVIISESTRTLYDPRVNGPPRDDALFRRSADFLIQNLTNPSADIREDAIIGVGELYDRWYKDDHNNGPFAYRRREIQEALEKIGPQDIFHRQARKALEKIV